MPFSVETYGKAACSSSERTAFVPFTVELHCDYSTDPDGCHALGTIDLSEVWIEPVLGYPTRKYQCNRKVADPELPIEQVAVELGGVKIESVPFTELSLAELGIGVEVLNFNWPTVSWALSTNWKDRDGVRVDDFNVVVYGELVWSTGDISKIYQSNTTCSAQASDCVAKTTLAYNPAWTFGGAALSGFRLKYTPGPGSPDGVEPKRITNKALWSASAGKARLTTACGIFDLSANDTIECEGNLVSIAGEPAEVETFTPPMHSLGAKQPTTVISSDPTGPKAAMRCGLRTWDVTSTPQDPRRFGALWVGAGQFDCGWDPGNNYKVPGLFDWRFEPPLMNDSYVVEWQLEGTRLP